MTPIEEVTGVNIIILAGGLGKRMLSDVPKVLHKIAGVSMLVKLIQEVNLLQTSKIIIVVGKYYDVISKHLKTHLDTELYNKIKYAHQPNPCGTGDAVRACLHLLQDDSNNLILNGDTPMLDHMTMINLIGSFVKSKASLQVTGIELDNSSGYGRLVLDQGELVNIIEEKDADANQKLIKLINCGIYISTGEVLRNLIGQLKNNNSQGEYYLTDIVGLFLENYKKRPGLVILDKTKFLEVAGVNTHEQLQELENLLILEKL